MRLLRIGLGGLRLSGGLEGVVFRGGGWLEPWWVMVDRPWLLGVRSSAIQSAVVTIVVLKRLMEVGKVSREIWSG